ncbi:hypothetical protein HYW53_00120 [Candidatus Giovannonibacteria bacterium]|nr:hypothetical protein [Candidatus Giovannonibacteria bacterium]
MLLFIMSSILVVLGMAVALLSLICWQISVGSFLELNSFDGANKDSTTKQWIDEAGLPSVRWFKISLLIFFLGLVGVFYF